jgi:hypothetical protein
MKIEQPTNSNILTSKPPKNGFVVGAWDDPDCYACVPIGNRLMVIHQGQQLKICNNEDSARNFIKKHKKRRKK